MEKYIAYVARDEQVDTMKQIRKSYVKKCGLPTKWRWGDFQYT